MTHPSSKEPDNHGPKAAEHDVDDGSRDFDHQLGTALTVIRGQAQLIRRRALRQGGDGAIALERSSVAIDSAVQRILGALAERAQDRTDDETEGDDSRSRCGS